MKESRPPHTTAWRFCTSCAVTLLCWAVWIPLGVALAWQGYVALVKDVSVPDFVLRRIESALAAENFSVRFGRAHLDPQGGILLEQVKLHSRSFEDPLLTSQFIYLRHSIWSILSGNHLPDVVRLEGASVQLPAILSPSGTAEPWLREVNADFRFSSELWSVERLTGLLGNLPISVTGNTPRPRSTGGTPLSATEITNRYLRIAREIVLALPELQAAEQPRLSVVCTPRDGGGIKLGLDFSAAALRRPGGRAVELGPLSVLGEWQWDGTKSLPLQLQLVTQEAVGAKVSANDIRAWLTLKPGIGKSLIGRVDGQIAAASLTSLGETFEAPLLAGSYSPVRDQLELTMAFQSYGQVLSLEGAIDRTQKSADIRFSGNVTPALVTGMLTRYGPKLEPYFRFGDPVEVMSARLALTEGWKFGGIWSRVRVGRLDSRGVQISSASGRVDVDADRNFYARDAHVVAGRNEARGSYWMNFRSMNYRFLLSGRLRPVEISGWFGGNWWPEFWGNFAFPSAPPQGDADVQGCWTDPRRTTYFGRSETGPAGVWNANFERARVRLFVRPLYVHALDLTVERAGGTQRATGWFKRFGVSGSRTANELLFDLTGNLDPATLQQLGGESAVNLLAPFALNHPPQLHLWGRSIRRSDGQTVNDLQFTGQVAGPLKYYYFPLDEVAVSGSLRGDKLQLDQIDLRTAGGHGHGQATLDGPAKNRLLQLDFKMKESDLARTIRAVEEFEAGRTGVKGESMAESKFIKRASGGKLDLALTAQGNPDNPTRLHGTGNLQLTGAELAEINLFGLLSQVLSAFSLNFSSLRLDAARSSFEMADGRVFFPDVRVTGRSALIDAKGTYFIDSKSLDFTAHLKPYDDNRNPLTAVVGLFMNPLTSMFELQLNGPLANPKWSVMLGSSAPKTFEPIEKPVTPAPAAASQP